MKIDKNLKLEYSRLINSLQQGKPMRLTSFLFTFLLLILFAASPSVVLARGGGPGNCVAQHEKDAVCTERTETDAGGKKLYCTDCTITCNDNKEYTGTSCTYGDSPKDRDYRKDNAKRRARANGNKPKPQADSGGSNNVLLRGGQSGGVLNACSEILQRTGEMTDISDIALYVRCKDSLSKQ